MFNQMQPDLTVRINDGKDGLFCIYIPFETSVEQEQIQEIANNTFRLSEYLGLGTDRAHYQPSYTHSYIETFSEVGLVGPDLAILCQAARDVQDRLRLYGCRVGSCS